MSLLDLLHLPVTVQLPLDQIMSTTVVVSSSAAGQRELKFTVSMVSAEVAV